VLLLPNFQRSCSTFLKEKRTSADVKGMNLKAFRRIRTKLKELNYV
jgi:hypothetical protein